MSPEPEGRNLRTEDELFRLDLEVRVEPSHLWMRYVLEAKTDERFCVFDALSRRGRDGIPRYDRLLAYAIFTPPARLEIKRIAPPPPKLISVEAPYIPWCRGSPEKRLVGEIRCPIPVLEWSQYYPTSLPECTYENVEANELSLLLEYIKLEPEHELLPIPQTEGIYRFRGLGSVVRTIEARLTLGKSIAVRRRTDEFEPL